MFVAVGTNRMVPSFPQEPPSKFGVSATNCGCPPATSTRWSLPFAENARERLSGDQNDSKLPSVPGSARAFGESSGRTQRTDPLPAASGALKARNRPSGDNAGAGIAPLNDFTEGRISLQSVVSPDCRETIERPERNATTAIAAARTAAI